MTQRDAKNDPMDMTHTQAFLDWLCTYDGRIQNSAAEQVIWHNALWKLTVGEVYQAVLDYTEVNGEKMVSPAAIRSRAFANRERAAAKLTALTASPAQRDKTYADYVKHMDRPEFRTIRETARRQWRRDQGLPEAS